MTSFEVPLQRSFGSAYTTELPALNKHYDAQIMARVEVVDDDVRSLSIGLRKCRFPDENDGIWAFPYYSYSACITQCKADQKMKLCNCTDRFIGKSQGIS